MLSKTCWKQKLGTDYNKYKSNRDANTLLKKLCYNFNEVNTFFCKYCVECFLFKNWNYKKPTGWIFRGAGLDENQYWNWLYMYVSLFRLITFDWKKITIFFGFWQSVQYAVYYCNWEYFHCLHNLLYYMPILNRI